MAPQSEWPQITMSFTFRWLIAYSRTVAKFQSLLGTTLPMLRCIKSSPGREQVIRSGFTLESEQPIQSTVGDWPFASFSCSSRWGTKSRSMKRLLPSKSLSII